MLNFEEKLSSLCRDAIGSYPNNIFKLQGDGSDRNIFRLRFSNSSYIGVYGENINENKAFISFTKQFSAFGLPVPALIAESADGTHYLVQDVGDTTLSDYVRRLCRDNKKHCIGEIYKNVLDRLAEFQINTAHSFDYSLCYQSKCFDYDAMMRDLHYFKKYFLDVSCRIAYNENKLLIEFDNFAEHLTNASPDFFLYRDFQSKNIMIVDNKPFFIDYQSGRRGALQYDVASLLFDANVELSHSMRLHLQKFYLKNLVNYPEIDVDQFSIYYDDFSLLRVLQTLAAFSFLSNEKGKSQFLKSIPPALRNVDYLLENKCSFRNMTELRTLFKKDILQNDEILSF